jgi:hypothetical protein
VNVRLFSFAVSVGFAVRWFLAQQQPLAFLLSYLRGVAPLTLVALCRPHVDDFLLFYFFVRIRRKNLKFFIRYYVISLFLVRSKSIRLPLVLRMGICGAEASANRNEGTNCNFYCLTFLLRNRVSLSTLLVIGYTQMRCATPTAVYCFEKDQRSGIPLVVEGGSNNLRTCYVPVCTFFIDLKYLSANISVRNEMQPTKNITRQQ